MEAYAHQKEQEEGERKRVLVERQHEPFAANWPRCVWLWAPGPGIAVHRLRLVGFLRLGRTLLIQKCRQQDVPEDLQELAFPVFRQRLPKMRGAEVGTIRDLRLAMLP